MSNEDSNASTRSRSLAPLVIVDLIFLAGVLTAAWCSLPFSEVDPDVLPSWFTDLISAYNSAFAIALTAYFLARFGAGKLQIGAIPRSVVHRGWALVLSYVLVWSTATVAWIVAFLESPDSVAGVLPEVSLTALKILAAVVVGLLTEKTARPYVRSWLSRFAVSKSNPAAH